MLMTKGHSVGIVESCQVDSRPPAILKRFRANSTTAAASQNKIKKKTKIFFLLKEKTEGSIQRWSHVVGLFNPKENSFPLRNLLLFRRRIWFFCSTISSFYLFSFKLRLAPFFTNSFLHPLDFGAWISGKCCGRQRHTHPLKSLKARQTSTSNPIVTVNDSEWFHLGRKEMITWFDTQFTRTTSTLPRLLAVTSGRTLTLIISHLKDFW